jgi:hypothetical protein
MDDSHHSHVIVHFPQVTFRGIQCIPTDRLIRAHSCVAALLHLAVRERDGDNVLLFYLSYTSAAGFPVDTQISV